MLTKLNCLYEGKAKSLYETNDPEKVIMHFRDDISAFNGEKLEKLAHKGQLNNCINAFIMDYLHKQNIHSHFIEKINDTDSMVKKLKMLPVECVVRNRVAGGLAKRLGLAEGLILKKPLVEFFYKSDALGDPFINEDHIVEFEYATQAQINFMKETSLKVNTILSQLFLNADLILVDFKLEFGVSNQALLLADEFTPDGCRLWDAQTLEKLDKDRFRRGLGNVVESYQMIADRLKINC